MTPKFDFLLIGPSKGTSLDQTPSFEPSIVKIGSGVWSGRVPMKKKPACMQIKKSQKCYISPIPRGAPSEPISTKLGSRVHFAIVIKSAEIDVDRLSSFHLAGSKILAFP